MSRLLFDIETNGLLPEVSKVHCLVIKDMDTGEKETFNDRLDGCSRIYEGLDWLSQADELWGHNILLYDLPVLQKLYGFPQVEIERIHDTLVLARLYKQNVREQDLVAWKAGNMPGQLIGRHSLEAWGKRLGAEKVGLDITDWSVWTPYMQERCEQDVEVNFQLYKRLKNVPGGSWPKAELLEHRASLLCSKIESNGIPFDTGQAAALYAVLCQMRQEMAGGLKGLFPDWVISKGEFCPKTSNKRTGNVAGCPFTRVEFIEFNPSSRAHIARCFTQRYRWEPTEFTDKGRPEVNEKILGQLPYPEAKPLAELFLIEKRIGQIAEGDEAWLKHVTKDGKIHHRINANGAVTGRATHSKPNISQVPKVGSRFGAECRSFFHVPNGWTQVGVDVAGLELRMLAHYMARYDDGEYGKAVIEGKEELGTDVHSLNCRAIGFDPQGLYTIGGKQQKGRNIAKTFIYAFLYGAGSAKIGSIVGKGPKVGSQVRERFLESVPALGRLTKDVQRAAKRGYLVGLDGRHMHVRSSHAALNTLLQGAGAAVCKQWIVEHEADLLEEGLKHGWDGDFAMLLWAHDETQTAARNDEIADMVENSANVAIRTVQDAFGIRLPLAVSSKRGRNWAECH